MGQMYKRPQQVYSKVRVNTSVQGETIEQKIERMISNKEPISDGMASPIFTERKEGIRAETNPRTDRWEIALEGTDKITKSRQARREEAGKVIDLKADNNSGAESTQATTE